jgi:hypothetical protein
MAVSAAIALGIGTAPASAAFGLKDLDLSFTGPDGTPSMQAGSHPYAVTTKIAVETKEDPETGKQVPDEEAKDVKSFLPAGLAGTPNPVPRCAGADFIALGPGGNKCPDSTAVGMARIEFDQLGNSELTPIYNLAPAPGVAAKLGFIVRSFSVTVDVGVKESPPYNIVATSTNITQAVRFFSAKLTVWGVPADPAHDPDRGHCLGRKESSCPVSIPIVPFLTMPTRCEGPLTTLFEADTWLDPGIWWQSPPILTHDNSEPPNPLGTGGCAQLGFSPRITAQATSHSAGSPSGLDLGLDINDEGLTNPTGVADSEIKKAVVTLPEGVTANPSLAEGLEACSEADLGREKAGSPFGAGCPADSKIGTVEVETPLLEGEILKGSVFVAEPYVNRFGTLIALYMTIKDPKLGINIILEGKVEPDPATGQLVASFDELPQQPFSHFRLHLREGARSPLITPPGCGAFETKALLTPWANPASPLTTASSFQITEGVGGGPCPAAGTPPFAPGFAAGTINNDAGRYSPFYMRLTRRDGDQDLTKFSATLPPGMVAKLAGTAQCPDAAIAAARAKTGKQELASPSCPISSQIGRVLAGAGVGSQLTYVPGKIYLSGPYNGAPLSVVAIVPAVAGPFDVGTVVTRQALVIDPRTAVVRADGSRSDPIPHILAGIPLAVRDIRVYVDKPSFTLNPTSCKASAVGAELWGGGANVFSPLDDSPVSRAARFQAADCAGLGFKPNLSLKLKGGTKRGAHPALTGVFTPRPGDANLSSLVLRLPHSAFLDQAHIRTICTRVQFAAKACPEGAVYGHATAYSPLLEQPLEGPVYLRSSDHNLPDFVASLHGLIDVEAVARIDSVHGGIRATFDEVPDAPLTKVVVNMQGAKKGLIVNSTNLCAAPHRADAQFTGQNGKLDRAKPLMQAGCGTTGGKHRKHRRHGRGA